MLPNIYNIYKCTVRYKPGGRQRRKQCPEKVSNKETYRRYRTPGTWVSTNHTVLNNRGQPQQGEMADCVSNLSPAMGARNQVGIGLSYQPAILCSLAT
jgi:hypothetical protein